MTEHHAISRRAFTGPRACGVVTTCKPARNRSAGHSPASGICRQHTRTVGQPPQFRHSPSPRGIFSHREQPRRQAFAATSVTCLTTARPTSSSLRTTKNDDTNWYAIRTLLNFEEHKKRATATFGRSTTTRTKMERSSTYGAASMTTSPAALLRSSVNQTEPTSSETARSKETEEKDIKYLAIESNGKDQDNNKICHKSKSIPWELELIGYDMKKNDATVSSLDWMHVQQLRRRTMLDEIRRRQQVPRRLSIPGTHDSGTCSVDNDTEPPILAKVKCQQDYIPTQLLEGIHYFDIRLRKGR